MGGGAGGANGANIPVRCTLNWGGACIYKDFGALHQFNQFNQFPNPSIPLPHQLLQNPNRRLRYLRTGAENRCHAIFIEKIIILLRDDATDDH